MHLHNLAYGEKLPNLLIGKGSSTKCEAGFGDIGEHSSTHSESGWTTQEVFIEYLQKLRDEHYPDLENPIWFMLDAYSVHRAPPIREFAGTSSCCSPRRG